MDAINQLIGLFIDRPAIIYVSFQTRNISISIKLTRINKFNKLLNC